MSKKFKRIMLLVVALLLSVSLIGCSGNEPSTKAVVNADKLEAAEKSEAVTQAQAASTALDSKADERFQLKGDLTVNVDGGREFGTAKLEAKVDGLVDLVAKSFDYTASAKANADVKSASLPGGLDSALQGLELPKINFKGSGNASMNIFSNANGLYFNTVMNGELSTTVQKADGSADASTTSKNTIDVKDKSMVPAAQLAEEADAEMFDVAQLTEAIKLMAESGFASLDEAQINYELKTNSKGQLVVALDILDYLQAESAISMEVGADDTAALYIVLDQEQGLVAVQVDLKLSFENKTTDKSGKEQVLSASVVGRLTLTPTSNKLPSHSDSELAGYKSSTLEEIFDNLSNQVQPSPLGQ